MEHSSVLQKEGSPVTLTLRMNLEGMTLRQIKWTQNDECSWSHVWDFKQWFPGALGVGKGHMSVRGYRLSVPRGVSCGHIMYSIVTIVMLYCVLEIC